MARIFICYRRDDAAGHAGRLGDALSSQFGAAEIFRDIETIAPGEDFVRAMSTAIEGCTVFLAVIGRNWLTAPHADGSRRLDDPDDHVRREIAEALRRGVRVIPVLVQDARMAAADLLPEELQELTNRNAIALDDDSWEADMQRLTAAIRGALDAAGRKAHTTEGAAGLRPERHDPGRSPAPSAGGTMAWLRPHPARVAAAVALLLAAAWARRQGREEATENIAGPGGTAREGPGSASTADRATTVTLQPGGEAALGQTTIEILGARLIPRQPVSTLELQVRLTNHGRYDALFSASAFRLVLGAQSHAPTTALSEVVASETAREASLSFDIRDDVDAGQLRISDGAERAEIALDFTAARGVTPEQDQEARRAGRTTFELPIDNSARTLRFGDLTCRLRAATLRRYVNKQTLTLTLDAENRGRYDAPFGDGYFRLLLEGGSTIAPVGGLSVVVAADSTRSGDLVFDLPLDAQQVTLRGRYGETTATISLQLPTRG
jgi:hypothetical protein